MSRPRLLPVVSLHLLVLAGCRTPEPAPTPFAGPSVKTSLRYFVGTSLSGPQEGKSSGGSLAPFTLEVIAQERWAPLATLGQAVGSQTRFLTVSAGQQPIRSVPRLAAAARIVQAVSPGQAATRCAVLSSREGVLERGVTAALRVEQAAGGSTYLELQIHRNPDDQLQLALVAMGAKEPLDDVDNPVARSRSAPELERELVLLDPLPGNAETSLTLLVPTPFASDPGEAIAFALVVGVPGGQDLPQLTDPAMAAALEDLKRCGQSPAVLTTEPPSAFATGLPPALDSLRHGPTQRQGLLHLARDASAPITEDLALVAEAAFLQECCARILDRVKAQSAALDPHALALLLETSTLEYVADLLARDKLAPELQSVLVRQAGQAGRQAYSLEEAVKAGSLAAVQARLIEENWIALEDNTPAARIRAFDWLRSRGQALEGYDPLAAPRDRRVALEKVQAARTAAAAPTGS